MEPSLDPDSPFSALEHTKPIAPSRTIFVNFCRECHYVWKAPAAAKNCLNCTNKGTAQCLISYESELFVL